MSNALFQLIPTWTLIPFSAGAFGVGCQLGLRSAKPKATAPLRTDAGARGAALADAVCLLSYARADLKKAKIRITELEALLAKMHTNHKAVRFAAWVVERLQ
jgi:hypothetical protein